MNAARSIWERARTYLLIGGVVAAIVAVVVWLDEKRLTIAIHQGVEGVALKAVIAKFSSLSGVAVEVVELPYDQLYASEMKDLDSATPRYDVIMIDDPWLPALIGGADGRDSRLEKLTFPGECDRLKDFVAPALQVCRHPYHDGPISCGDTFYALPFVGNSQLFCFRRGPDGMAKAPTTWAGVLEISGKQATGNSGYVMRVGPGNQIVTDFMPMLWSASPDSFQASTPRLQPGAKEALGHLAGLGSSGNASLAIVSFDDFDLAIHLAKRKASMSIVWSAWAMAMAKLPEPYRSRLFQDIAFAEMPGGHPTLGAWLLAIPANGREKGLAREFLVFATGRAQIAAATIAGNPPPLKSVLEDPELITRFPSFPAQLQSLQTAKPRPRTPHWRDIESALGDCLSALYESSITEDQALARANKNIGAILAGKTSARFTCKADQVP